MMIPDSNPSPDDLIQKLEEAIHEPVISFSIFSDTKMPSNWHIYNAEPLETYMADPQRYTIVLYIPKKYEGYLCSTSIAVFDRTKDKYIAFACCYDEG
jgi:hypothetical protein